MNRIVLIRKITRRAWAGGLIFELRRQGGDHEVWSCGRVRVSIPRHREINRKTAHQICTELERELGERWRR